jgi:NAD(P)-dependent dehydrogenase (short-subunit alcohol dehydrogenase family)
VWGAVDLISSKLGATKAGSVLGLEVDSTLSSTLKTCTSLAMPVALVTGSAQGIGRGIALRLADDGFDLAINDLKTKLSELHDLAKEITSKGRQVAIVPGNVDIEEDVQTLVNETVKSLGSLDVVTF